MSHAPYEPIPQAPPQWAQQPIQPSRAPSRLLPVLGVVLGSLGLIAGVAAWFRAAPSNEGASAVYSEQQVSEAKKAVCETFEQGMRSIRAAGNRRAENPAESFSVAVNTRLAEVAVANAFFNTLNANPASPPELSGLIRQLGVIYEDIALTQLADGSKVDVDPIATQLDDAIPKVDGICR